MAEITKSYAAAVLQAMRPGCFYRSQDVAQEARIEAVNARRALWELSRGGVIERVGDSHTRVYITK